MKSQPILLVSGALLMTFGVALLFAPHEIGAALAGSGAQPAAILVQLYGTSLFALGFLDLFSRFSLLGGIHGRPVVVANFAFFFTTAVSLLRHAPAARHAALEWALVATTGALALWFGRYLFGAPPAPGTNR